MIQQVTPHTFGFKAYVTPGGQEMLADPSFNQALDPGRWQTTDPDQWSIDTAAGKAVCGNSGGYIYQSVQLIANTTYNVEIQTEGNSGGGIYFQMINPGNGNGLFYRNLPQGLHQFTITPTTDEVRRFAIVGNSGGGRVLVASLKPA